MKTAREWFEKLRPDLRDRAIKATKNLDKKYTSFSIALFKSFGWDKEEGITLNEQSLWDSIYQEAIDIEQGRKPDIKPKK